MQTKDNTIYTFDVPLQHNLNTLNLSLRNEAFLPNFIPPGVYTGERIGVDYLRSQSDILANKDLEKEIDEAFDDFQCEEESADEQLMLEDLTLALTEDSSESDSGTEVCCFLLSIEITWQRLYYVCIVMLTLFSKPC